MGRGTDSASRSADRTLTGRRQPGTGPVRAVKLAGARITGVLDLEAARLACPLLLDGCSADQPINLKEAHAAAT
jgi:hypothetical protein